MLTNEMIMTCNWLFFNVQLIYKLGSLSTHAIIETEKKSTG